MEGSKLDTRILTVRLRRVTDDVHYDEEDGHVVAMENSDIELYLYGHGLSKDTVLRLTTSRGEYGDDCSSEEAQAQSGDLRIFEISSETNRARLSVKADQVRVFEGHTLQFFCLKTGDNTYVHQGHKTDALLEIKKELLPIGAKISFIAILLCMSGLFSGLNLGLMALDKTELKLVQNTGTPTERKFADKIAPIRQNGNFLLCSLLLGNVLVNNALTLLIEDVWSGTVAIIGATLGIVIVGEIVPQSICSRHGLAVGAYTAWLTKFFMLLTFPLSYPTSLILDSLLGEELGTVYTKRRLIELLKIQNERNDLDMAEAEMIEGALKFKDKTVEDIMTKLDDIYMLPLEAVLDFDTVSSIREQGYSRIPIYHRERKNIVYVLFAKDLMFVDPDHNMPVTTVCQFYCNNVNFVFHDTPLNVMFNEFKSGDKGHMAFVQNIHAEEQKDPYYETIGLVTLEDVIEEIIQQEITDETDVVTDNRTRKKLTRAGRKGKGPSFTLLNPNETRKVLISPQHVLAVFQYLSTSVSPFKFPFMEADVLKKLLSMDVYKEIKLKHARTNEAEAIIIQKGQKLDFFVLIIEGRVSVNVGVEELRFECGPFTYFGIQVLRDCLCEFGPPLADTVGSTSHKLKPSLRRAYTQGALVGGDKLPARRQVSNASTASLPVGGVGQSGKESPPAPFVSEYTVKASSDLLYLLVPQDIYSMAAKASMLQTSSSPSLASKDLRKIDQMLWGDEEQASPYAPILLHTTAETVKSNDDDDSDGEMLELLPRRKRSGTSDNSLPGRE